MMASSKARNNDDEDDQTFGFTKDLLKLARRPSFAETLNFANGKWMEKKTGSGLWIKRWCLVHGHYLSYYRDDPELLAPKERIPLGVLNLWHVLGVSLDDCEITLELSEEASEARKGGELVRNLISRVSRTKLLSKSALKQVEDLRRRHIKPVLVLKTYTPAEAHLFLQAMKESSLNLSAATTTTTTAPTTTETITPLNELPRVRELAFAFGKREILFDHFRVLEGGSTKLLLRNVGVEVGECSCVLEHASFASSGGGTVQLREKFSCPLSDSEGNAVLALETPVRCAVEVQWVRAPLVWITPIFLPFCALSLGLFFVLASLVFRTDLKLAFTSGVLLAGAWAVQAIRDAMKVNSIVINNVSVTLTLDAPSTTTTATTTAEALITHDELSMIQLLRSRCQDLYQQVHAEIPTFIKRNEKFIKDYHCDVRALTDSARIKLVLDKHMQVDFRIVRFLRARKHNVKKAEVMLRDCLLWRILLSSDELPVHDVKRLLEKEIPSWMVSYFVSPLLVPKLVTSDSDRLKRFYLRDRENHLALFLRTGRMNTRKFLRKCSGKPCYLIRHLVLVAEMLRRDLELHREESGVEDLVSVIVDLEGFAVSEQIPMGDLLGIAKRFFPIFATGFPELLKRVLVFNAPWLFGSLWNAVKPFIPEEVQEKIQIHSGKIIFEKHIGKYYAKDQVPKYFGGNLVEGNEECKDRVVAYAPYFMENEGAELLEGTDDKSVAW